MNIYKKDYSKLYRLQIKFLNWLQELDLPFYLTGETALARFYLNHRYRDEPKDVFDIIYISENYAFNWSDVFLHAKQKSAINEIDIEQRLNSFPIELLESIIPIKEMSDLKILHNKLIRIADDFLLGEQNRLGEKKLKISEINPQLQT